MMLFACGDGYACHGANIQHQNALVKGFNLELFLYFLEIVGRVGSMDSVVSMGSYGEYGYLWVVVGSRRVL